ncbi:MAG TPA: AmmeMemoRadiSam system protein A [Geobacterales bacterium]|nr:AmmeMemoRadiSam system protein A [Geobacterales bacterium]
MFTSDDETLLLSLAHQAIIAHIDGKLPLSPPPHSPLLEAKRGCFVCIKRQKNLRGCLGVFTSDKPLIVLVPELAIAAANHDPRFHPVTILEAAELQVEISILSPLKPVHETEEIEVGRHGIYIVQGGKSGVLLPQVATEQGWDRETFLQQTCIKAGLPFDAWEKGASISSFTAHIFGDPSP